MEGTEMKVFKVRYLLYRGCGRHAGSRGPYYLETSNKQEAVQYYKCHIADPGNFGVVLALGEDGTEAIKDLADFDKYPDPSAVTTEGPNMKITSRDEISLLLHLESRAVDYGGRLDLGRISADECALMDHWASVGFITPGHETHGSVSRSANDADQRYVCLSDDAWAQAHAQRRARAERLAAPWKPKPTAG